MKRIKIVGLCLVAVFAFSAVAAASASASERPEYKKCGKAPKVGKTYPTGEFSNKECTTAAPGGKYRLEEVPAKTAFTSKSKAATLTVAGKVVKCKKDTDKGEILEQFSATVQITFEGCAINGNKKEPCGTEGKIETKLLNVGLYFLNESNTESGVALNAEEGPFAEFKCGTETVTIEGYLIGSVKNSKKGETISFVVTGGKQAHKTVWVFGEMEPPGLTAGGGEVTLETTDEQGPKGIGVFPS
jgi:hypothetical protein